jgi:hypothetical protein
MNLSVSFFYTSFHPLLLENFDVLRNYKLVKKKLINKKDIYLQYSDKVRNKIYNCVI